MTLGASYFAIGLFLRIYILRRVPKNETKLITEQKKGRVGINEFSGVFGSFGQDSCSRNL